MTERTYTADEVDAMIARAVAAAKPAKTLHFAQWTNGEKDLSNYILVGQLTLAGIENGEYGTSEIKPLDNTIDALQERLITGSEHKWVPLLAYIGGLNTTPPAQPAPTQDIPDLIAGALGVSRGTAYDLMREALKEAALVQEPVAVCHDDGYWTPLKTEAGRRFNDLLSKAGSRINVYTAPPAAQREWVGLTDDDFHAICTNFRVAYGGWVTMLALEIEAKLKERNQ